MNISILQSSLPFCEKPILSLNCNISNPRIIDRALKLDINLESRHLFPEHAERPIGVICPQFLEKELFFEHVSPSINTLSTTYSSPLQSPLTEKSFLQLAYGLKVTQPQFEMIGEASYIRCRVIVDVFFRTIDPSMSIPKEKIAVYEELHSVYSRIGLAADTEKAAGRISAKATVSFDDKSFDLAHLDSTTEAEKFEWKVKQKEFHLLFSGKIF